MSSTEPTLVGSRYELGELLGRGGMAEVRKGTDTRLGRVVAVKRLRTDLASDSTFQARFRREAQSSASLNHPAIVSVYDTGEELTEDGVAQPYIVMEYVAGRTLRDILREGRKILPERALEITSGVLAALDYSHRAGIIHRDIKPGNVMLNPMGDVKVMDFGIARAVSDASSSMTQTAAVVGTAQYLSPEQARGETVDSRSDVYSAGCLLYELLTGRPPFVGDSPVAVVYQHVREPATPPSMHDADLPPQVDAIVMKSLAKPVEDRYQSAAAMRSDIERYLAGRPVAAPPVPVPEPTYDEEPARTTVTRTVPPPRADDEDDERRTSVGLLVFLGLVLAALIAAGVIFLPQLFESPPDTVQVPNVIGQTEAQARALLGDEGLLPERRFGRSTAVAAGRVYDQDPGRDQAVAPGSTVIIFVSMGRPEVAIPDLVGDTRAEAQQELTRIGLTPRFEEVDSDEPAGEVVETRPDAGQRVERGTEVQVDVSDGPEEIPDVVGQNQESAELELRESGFEPVVVLSSDTTEPAGQVISQIPSAGQQAPQGSQVTIVVSAFEPTPTAPTSPTATAPSQSPSPSQSTSGPPDPTLPTDPTTTVP